MTALAQLRQRAATARALADMYTQQRDDLERIAREAEDRADSLDAEVAELEYLAIPTVAVDNVLDFDYQKQHEAAATSYEHVTVIGIANGYLYGVNRDGGHRTFVRDRISGGLAYSTFTGGPIRV